MRFLRLYFFLFALACLAAPALAGAAPKFEITGWVPYWRAATGTQDVIPHLSQLASVHPFGYTVKTDGTLYDAMGIDKEPWVSLIAAAKAQKVKVIPTVMWSNKEAIHAVLRNATKRRALEDAIATLVKQNGFDGIDIDFENKKAETKNYFSLFLQGLYQRMGDKWVYCAIEPRMPPGDSLETLPATPQYANDYVAINKYCDRVQIMAYDQGTVDLKLNAAAQGKPYIPVADPQWVRKIMLNAAKTIAKNKLMIGIPTYGYEYVAKPLSQSGFRYALQWAFNQKYALDLAREISLTPVRNSAGEMSLAYNPSGSTAAIPPPLSELDPLAALPNTASTSADSSKGTLNGLPFNILWWSDAQAVADKVKLAHELGLRGVAIFKFDGGEDPGTWAVLK